MEKDASTKIKKEVKTKIINCLNCLKEKITPVSEIKRGFGKFCSVSCGAKFKNKNKQPLPCNVSCALCKMEFHINESKKKQSKSGLYFCCRRHKDDAQRIGGIKEIMPAHYGTASPKNCYRRIAFFEKKKECERCGYNQNTAAIIVHHIDRNRDNNVIENLEVLCANCHYIEHYGDDDNKYLIDNFIYMNKEFFTLQK